MHDAPGGRQRAAAATVIPPMRRVAARTMQAADTLAATGMGAVLVFAPLAFGAVHFWAFTTVEVALAAVAAVWCLRAIVAAGWNGEAGTREAHGRARLRRVPWAALFAGTLGLWFVFALVPLPPNVLTRCSPATHALLVDSLPGWPQTPGYAEPGAGAVAGGVWRPLAVAPFAARAELQRLFAYAVAFFVAAFYPWRKSTTAGRRLAQMLIAVGLFEATYTLFASVTGSPMVYWYRKPPGAWLPSGTYVNRNHLAGYLEMIAPLAGALALAAWAEVLIEIEQLRGAVGRGARGRLAGALLATGAVPRLVLYGSATLWLMAGLYSSLSRGGFLSPLAATGLLLPLLYTRRRAPARWIGPAGVVAGMILLVSVVSLPDLARRLDSAGGGPRAAGDRWTAVRGAAAAAADFPVFGTGLGSFAFTFPRYREVGGGRFEHAHNDYLELIVEAGWPAGVLAILLVCCWYRRVFRAFTRTTEATPYLLWGVAVGVTALLLHGLVDFNFHVPANALTFAVLLGLGVRLSRDPRGADCLRPFARAGLAAVVLLGLGVAASVGYRPMGAEAQFRRWYPDSSLVSAVGAPPRRPAAGQMAAELAALAAALPDHAFVRYLTGIELQRAALERLAAGDDALALLTEAARQHRRAARVLPLWPAPHLQLGILGLVGAAGLEETEARAALDRAARLDPHSPAVADTLARIRSVR